jgi:phage shock protein A
MGLFSRLGAMIRGFFGLFVRGVEDKNPEALFEDIRNQIDQARKDAEKQIIDIQTNAELMKIEMKRSEKELETIRSRIDMAKRQGQKDLLVELLIQEEDAQVIFDANKDAVDTALNEVERIKEDYKIFESDMNRKLNEIRTLKSQAKVAGLREDINSANARYSARNNRVGKVNEGMDRARDIVNTKTARANAMESLGGMNTETKLRRLDADSARDRARARAEALLSGDEKGFEVKEKVTEKL